MVSARSWGKNINCIFLEFQTWFSLIEVQQPRGFRGIDEESRISLAGKTNSSISSHGWYPKYSSSRTLQCGDNQPQADQPRLRIRQQRRTTDRGPPTLELSLDCNLNYQQSGHSIPPRQRIIPFMVWHVVGPWRIWTWKNGIPRIGDQVQVWSRGRRCIGR